MSYHLKHKKTGEERLLVEVGPDLFAVCKVEGWRTKLPHQEELFYRVIKSWYEELPLSSVKESSSDET